MNDLLSSLTNQLGNDFIGKVSQSLGSDTKKTGSAVDMALPMILGALSKNTQSKKGTEAFHKALMKKHDGSVLKNISALVQNPDKGEGAGILKHILGNKEGMIEKLIADKTGLDTKGSTNILKILAPLVMGALGKQAKEGSLDFGSLSGLLGKTADKVGDKSVSSSLVSSLLDKDGDGDIKDDLMTIGMGALKKKFFG